MKKRDLDYLVIPSAGGKVLKERKKRALEEIHERNINEVLILKGKNSEEDILYLGKILKQGERVGFDTFPLHFKEYEEIIKRAKKEGKFPKGVKIENIRTVQPPKLFVYGVLGWLDEHFKKKVEYKKRERRGIFGKIKDIIKKTLTS